MIYDLFDFVFVYYIDVVFLFQVFFYVSSFCIILSILQRAIIASMTFVLSFEVEKCNEISFHSNDFCFVSFKDYEEDAKEILKKILKN